MSGPYFQDVEAGDELPSVVKEPTREQLDAFTTVWGTGIGRFTSDEAARAEGFSGVILPGNMTMALLAQFLKDWAGPDGKLKRLDVDFQTLRAAGRPAHFYWHSHRHGDGGGGEQGDSGRLR